jgi:hypothetical protein
MYGYRAIVVSRVRFLYLIMASLAAGKHIMVPVSGKQTGEALLKQLKETFPRKTFLFYSRDSTKEEHDGLANVRYDCSPQRLGRKFTKSSCLSTLRWIFRTCNSRGTNA